MVGTRHNVFISFQKGCPDIFRECGTAFSSSFPGQIFFNQCIGQCGKHCGFNVTTCVNYYKCGIYWKERFEWMMSKMTDKMISKAVGDGDIPDGIKTETTRQKIRNEFIADASVTVVLIGPETWKRKHVDWEISSSIINTALNPRCGLLGILLPTHPSFNKASYNQYIIPPRLYYNQASGFAHIYDWSENPDIVQEWIHAAYLRKDIEPIDNSYPMFRRNRADNQQRWDVQ